ncbi:MAG: hypothetical protein KBS84_02675 [Treponema sp.]|nr:hypothetical protein [Candidatus Treponema scatequi]
MKKLLILIASACLIGLTGCAFSVDVDFDDFKSSKYSSRTVDVSSRIDFLDINWPYGTVRFIEHDGSNVEFYETSSRQITENNTLTYCYDSSCNSLFIDYYNTNLRRCEIVRNKVLIVYIPRYRRIDCVRVNGEYTECK